MPIHFLNFALFIFWMPLLFAILGIKFTDLFQLLPVITNLLFLLSPILYEKKNLGRFDVIADYNPFYQVLRLLRDGLINGQLFFFEGMVLFIILNFLLKKFSEVPGVISSLFLIFYSLFRFIIEFTREPDAHLGMLMNIITYGQTLSIVFFISGVILFKLVKK